MSEVEDDSVETPRVERGLPDLFGQARRLSHQSVSQVGICFRHRNWSRIGHTLSVRIRITRDGSSTLEFLSPIFLHDLPQVLLVLACES